MKKILKHIGLIFSFAFIFLVATACGGSTITSLSLAVSGKDLNNGYYYLFIGETANIIPTTDVPLQNMDQLVWQSSNESVATVTAGQVTPKAVGTVTISATLKENPEVMATIAIKVFTKGTGLSFPQAQYNVIYGNDYDIRVEQNYEGVVYTYTGKVNGTTTYNPTDPSTKPRSVGIYRVTAEYDSYFDEATIIIGPKTIEIDVDNYTKQYGQANILDKDGLTTNVFSEGKTYTDPQTKDVIEYTLRCSAVDVANINNTKYADVGSYAIEIDYDRDVNFNYVINSKNGVLTINKLALTLIPEPKTVVYGNLDASSTKYALYSTAALDETHGNPAGLEDYTSSAHNNVFTNQISVSTAIYKGGYAYTGKMNVGEYTLNCQNTQLKNSNNLTLTVQDTTYTVIPRPLEIIPDANQFKYSGTENPTYTYTTNTGGIVEGDTLVPFLDRNVYERNNREIDKPGTYAFVIKEKETEDFIVNDNYDIQLTENANAFEIRANSVYFVIHSKTLDYGTPDADIDFTFTLLFNGVQMENVEIDNNGYITLRNEDKIKIAFKKAVSAEVESEGYYSRYKIFLDTQFAETNDGYGVDFNTPTGDVYYNVSYNNLSSAFINYKKITLYVQPYVSDESLVTKIYDNDRSTDGKITEATCTGYVGTDSSYTDVFESIEFAKIDESQSAGTYPLVLQNYVLKSNKDFYNVQASDTVVNYTITQRNLVITPLGEQSKLYGSDDKTFEYKITNTAAGDTKESVVRSITIGRANGENVGTYSYILANADIDKNYTYSFNTTAADSSEIVFTINPRTVDIFAHSHTMTYGNSVPELTYTWNVRNATGDTFNSRYNPTLSGTLYSSVTSSSIIPFGSTQAVFPITQGSITAGDNFIINYTEGSVTLIQKEVTFNIFAEQIESGATPDVSTLQYVFTGLLDSASVELNLNILPDNESNPTKYSMSGVIYGRNNDDDNSLTFNYTYDNTTYNSLTVTEGGQNTTSCYSYTISSTTAFYISSLVLNLSIVSVTDNTSNLVETVYDGFEKYDMFTVLIDDNNYSIKEDTLTYTYRQLGLDRIPVNAGTYSVGVLTDSLIIIKNATGEEIPASINIASYGNLTIDKANLYIKGQPELATPFQYGSEAIGDVNAELYTDSTFETLFDAPITSSYNTLIYTTDYIKSLTVNGSPYNLTVTLTPTNEQDRNNYNSVTVSLALQVNPRIIEISSSSFTYKIDGTNAVYTGKLINNPLNVAASSNPERVSVSYSYTGVTYSDTVGHYGLIAYYDAPELIGNSSNVKYAYRNEITLDGWDFTIGNSYFVKTNGTETMYIPITHGSGIPTNAGIYYITASVRSNNSNYAVSGETSFADFFEIMRSEDILIKNWKDQFMFGTSEETLLTQFDFTTSPARVRSQSTIDYSLKDVEYVSEDSKIIKISDGEYTVDVTINSVNHYAMISQKYTIIQLDAVFMFPVVDKYQFTGMEIDAVIKNTIVDLYDAESNLEESVTYETFMQPNALGNPTVTVSYFPAYADGTKVDNTSLASIPSEVGYYLLECVYNDGIHYGEGTMLYEITKAAYTGYIKFINTEIEYDPDLVLHKPYGSVKDDLYDIVFKQMVKIPEEEEGLIHYLTDNGEMNDNDYSENIYLSVRLNRTDILAVDSDPTKGIKNVGDYTLTLILDFANRKTIQTTMQATLSIKQVTLSTSDFQLTSNVYEYSGYKRFNEALYKKTNAVCSPSSDEATGFQTVDIYTGWLGYLNADKDNFCIVYNYYKLQPDGVTYSPINVLVDERNAPISPGKYKVVHNIYGGKNYITSNVNLPDVLFEIKPVTQYTQISTYVDVGYNGDAGVYVYNGGNFASSANIAGTNGVSETLKITCVYEDVDGYKPYTGGAAFTAETYKETYGIVFEKYFYKYASYDPNTETGVLIEEKLHEIKNAGYYKVCYKLVYPDSANYYNYIGSTIVLNSTPYTFDTIYDVELSNTITIEKAPFPWKREYSEIQLSMSVPTDLSKVLEPASPDNEYGLVEDPIFTAEYGSQIIIKLTGGERENISTSIYAIDENGNETLFTSVVQAGDEDSKTYRLSNLQIGTYFFIFSHSKDGIVNYYDSGKYYFSIVKAFLKMDVDTSTMVQQGETNVYVLNETVFFEVPSEGSTLPVTLSVSFNQKGNVETTSGTWVGNERGIISGITYVFEYYSDADYTNKLNVASINSLNIGTYFVSITINSANYIHKTPLHVTLKILATGDYTVQSAYSFVYNTYTGFEASAYKMDMSQIPGTGIFLRDKITDASEIALLETFKLENPTFTYYYETHANQDLCISQLSYGRYYGIGLYRPTDTNYAVKAFGYIFTVEKAELDLTKVQRVDFNESTTVNIDFSSTPWGYQEVILPIDSQGEITFTDGSKLPVTITSQVTITLKNAVLTEYFTSGKNPLDDIGMMITLETQNYRIQTSSNNSKLYGKLYRQFIKPSFTNYVSYVSTTPVLFSNNTTTVDVQNFNYAYVATEYFSSYADLSDPEKGFTSISLASTDTTVSHLSGTRYQISATGAGTYILKLYFTGSKYFQDTQYDVVFTINRTSVSLIRYSLGGGEYINHQGSLYSDYIGEYGENGITYFYTDNEGETMIGEYGDSLNVENLEFYINGSWVSYSTLTDPSGVYKATVNFSTSYTEIVEGSTIESRAYSGMGEESKVYVFVKFTDTNKPVNDILPDAGAEDDLEMNFYFTILPMNYD